MEDADFERKWSVAGPFTAGILTRAREPKPLPARPVLDMLWSEADGFAIVARMKAPKKPLPAALALLPRLGPDLTDLVWATEWPHTRRRPGALVAFGRCTATSHAALVAPAASTCWALDGWEDLQLFRGEKLVLSVCTHEEVGFLCGSREVLASFGADPVAVGSRPDEHVVRGRRVRDEERASWLS